jgi:hypothetical protein
VAWGAENLTSAWTGATDGLRVANGPGLDAYAATPIAGSGRRWVEEHPEARDPAADDFCDVRPGYRD